MNHSAEDLAALHQAVERLARSVPARRLAALLDGWAACLESFEPDREATTVNVTQRVLNGRHQDFHIQTRFRVGPGESDLIG